MNLIKRWWCLLKLELAKMDMLYFEIDQRECKTPDAESLRKQHKETVAFWEKKFTK